MWYVHRSNHHLKISLHSCAASSNVFSDNFLEIALTSMVCIVNVFGPPRKCVLNLFVISIHRSTITNETKYVRLRQEKKILNERMEMYSISIHTRHITHDMAHGPNKLWKMILLYVFTIYWMLRLRECRHKVKPPHHAPLNGVRRGMKLMWQMENWII